MLRLNITVSVTIEWLNCNVTVTIKQNRNGWINAFNGIYLFAAE
jgi:hypothetical protein